MTSATPEAVPLSKPVQHRRIVKAGRPLSKKELEVLRWATQGKTVWEISVIRAISPATVKFHLSNIYAKLGVSNVDYVELENGVQAGEQLVISDLADYQHLDKVKVK